VPRGPVQRGVDGTWWAARYDGPVRAALLAYKERGRRDLAEPLGRLLARSVAAAWAAERSPPPRVVLVPAPSARSVAAARGGDHVLRLARRAGARCGLRTAGGVLTLTRSVRDSAGLGIAERAANLSRAVVARPAPVGVGALVVDDIVTTGATLHECVRALREAGWPVIGTAVVAATPRRSAGVSAPLAEHSHTV
jgi:predicted amidophosphoribosyltransferase